jgi:hypothetical protein
MIAKKTVLVLGAGASYAYGFPLGSELRDEIINSKYSVDTAREYDLDIRQIRDIESVLPYVPVYSIDAFLERRREFIDIGKKLIAIHLLQKEITTGLFDGIVKKRILSRINNDCNPIEDWYQYLFNLLGNNPEQFKNNQLVVVTFNYDRSLEHYLFESVKNSFNLDDRGCQQSLQSIKFIHVYGSLGKLPWQDGEMPTVKYDAWQDSDKRFVHIRNAANCIKILHENTEDTPELLSAREHIREANKVLFLGFGFHTVNVMRLLHKDLAQKETLYGTIKGMDVHKKHELCNLGLKAFTPNWEGYFYDTTILDFLKYNEASRLE